MKIRPFKVDSIPIAFGVALRSATTVGAQVHEIVPPTESTSSTTAADKMAEFRNGETGNKLAGFQALLLLPFTLTWHTI